MSDVISNTFGLSEDFFNVCLSMSSNSSSISHKFSSQGSTLPSLSSHPSQPLIKLDDDDKPRRLLKNYPQAFTDFHGTPSGAPCIFKTGSPWPSPVGPNAQPYERELRAVSSDHPIVEKWPGILKDISEYLVSHDIQLSSIDGVGVANAGAKDTFCPLLIWIGVLPNTLPFEMAKTTAEYVKGTILTQAGFPDLEVAFRESKATFHGKKIDDSKFISFDTLLDPVLEHRKHFTTTPGVAIASYKTPYLEGTGCLYFRLSNDPEDKRVALLTTAHVARPPSDFSNNQGMTYKNASQPREDIVALGEMAFQNAMDGIKCEIGTLIRTSAACESKITKLHKIIDGGDDAGAQESLERAQKALSMAKMRIRDLNELHVDQTKRMPDPSQRIIGHLLHSDPIHISDDGYTLDWAFVELCNDKVDWDSFSGNKVWVGGDKVDFGGLMFPHPEDQADYKVPEDDLLQTSGVVPMEEIRCPKQLNKRGEKALPVVKNGRTTATTFGWVNPLESLVRNYSPYSTTRESMEVSIVRYGGSEAFSADGDSGSAVHTRDGRVVGMITSGSGLSDGADITYCTPFCKLEERIKQVFPGCFLYPSVE